MTEANRRTPRRRRRRAAAAAPQAAAMSSREWGGHHVSAPASLEVLAELVADHIRLAKQGRLELIGLGGPVEAKLNRRETVQVLPLGASLC